MIETSSLPRCSAAIRSTSRRSTRRLDAVAVDNWFAKAAIEMACWDIAGRAAGKPVYELLGGAAGR